MSGKEKRHWEWIKSVLMIAFFLVLCIGGIQLVQRLMNKVNDLFNPTFRVAYDGKDYENGNTYTVALPSYGDAVFTVKAVDEYSVQILPNVTAETDFTYTVDGKEYWYSKTDLSMYFFRDIDMDTGEFVIDCNRSLDLQDVLETLYGKEVTMHGTVISHYALTFRSEDEYVTFLFGGKFTLSLSQDQIIF